MHTISVKQLRTKLPHIRSQLKKGEEFLLIYQSTPIAKISPVNSSEVSFEEELKNWEQVATKDIEKHVPYLTKEEFDYYMNL